MYYTLVATGLFDQWGLSVLVFLEYEQMIGIATDVAGLGNTITYLESDMYIIQFLFYVTHVI